MIWLRIGLILLPFVIGGVGGWIINDKAYNRGVTATVKKMEVLIDKGTERRDIDWGKLKTTPEDRLDEELRKLCERHKKPGQTCAP